MFRKTLTALVAVAGLSLAGAAFADEPANSNAPAATTSAKPSAKSVTGKKAHKKGAKSAAKSETKSEGSAPAMEQKAQPRTPTASKKIHRQGKKAQRAGGVATPAPVQSAPVQK